uniref:Ig-like domain-containing protein n=1 Tax=Oreochromis aureus TaxID=47969 RepID=A0AAZ1X9Z8_OREAU
MKLFLLIAFCHGLFAVKHSLKNLVTGSYGIPIIPDFVGVLLVDDIQTGYCDSSQKTFKIQHDWAEKILENDPQQKGYYNRKCFEEEPNKFRQLISSLKGESEGVHILQRIDGCELDKNTGEVAGVLQYGHNGEDFLRFDLKTLKWIAQKPEAESIKQTWNADVAKNNYYNSSLTGICPQWLKKYLDAGNSSLQRRDLPSVSLLQKTPSSPVSCHATGFYPDRAVMFWRKDGEKVHEGVDPGEILPNNDETFQMSVDLNVSSPEDWRRYECVFQLSGGDEHIVTKLDKTLIRRNWKEKNDKKTNIFAVVVPVLLILCAVGVVVYRKRRASAPSTDSVLQTG